MYILLIWDLYGMSVIFASQIGLQQYIFNQILYKKNERKF